MSKFKIALGGIMHETHGFSPKNTAISEFKITRGLEIIENYRDIRNVAGGAIAALESAGCEIVPTFHAHATPGGLVLEEDFLGMLKELADSTQKSGADGILLNLHGAMLSENHWDCEGLILSTIREKCSGIPIVACLDLHANITPQMVEYADILVGYDSNPHLDQYERGQECAYLLVKALENGVPAKAYRKLPLLLSPLTTWTQANPLSSGLAMAHKLEESSDIWSITVSGGFAYADHPYIGVSVLAYADTLEAASESASKTARAIWENRAASFYMGYSAKEAVARAAFTPSTPVCIADTGDNIGGGSAGDGTFVLEEMISAGVHGAFVIINDPEAVEVAKKNGIGGDFFMPIGGKTDNLHGRSIPFKGIVANITDGHYAVGKNNHHAGYGSCLDMGDCTLIKGDGIDVMLTSVRIPPGDVEMMMHIGADPFKDYRMINVKAAVAFRGNYECLNGEIIDASTDGLTTCDLFKIPYTKTPNLYPFDKTIEYTQD